MQRHSLFIVGIAAFLAVTSGCKPLVEELPDTSPTSTRSVVTTNPLPAPAGIPKPSPTDLPPADVSTPVPPSRTPNPGGTAAPPPAGDTSCVRNGDAGAFIPAVVAAETAALQQHPEYLSGGTCVKTGLAANGVSWRDLYYNAVLANLNGAGLSAVNDAGGEIAVKSAGVAQGTGFSEQYQLLFSSACVHPCPDCYRATCTPAWF